MTPTLKVDACARITAGKPASAVAPAATPAVLRKPLRSVLARSVIPLSLLGCVVVEAAPGLSPEPSRDDHALQERRGRVAGLAEFFEHHFGDEHGRVEADEVQQRERPHRVAAT